MFLAVCLFITAILATAQFWLWADSKFKSNAIGTGFVWGVLMFFFVAANLIKH